MKDAALVIVAIVALVCAVVFGATEERTIVYDCRLVEISPDFPIEVRNACRKRMFDNLKNENRNVI